VQLDSIARGLSRGFYLFFVRRNKGADQNPFLVHSPDNLCKAFFLFDAIEAAFRGQLSSFFGDQSYLLGYDSFGDFDYRLGHAHFEIQFAGDGLFEDLDITVVDVAAVLAKVDGDSVCACEFALSGRPDGVRLVSSPRLPYGRDMVNIDI
jgi:hypothetical protein